MSYKEKKEIDCLLEELKEQDIYNYNRKIEVIVNNLSKRLPLLNKQFIRIYTYYNMCKIFSYMNMNVEYMSDTIPINMYALLLSPSGSGKGTIMNLFKDKINHKFIKKYTEEFYQNTAKAHIYKNSNTLGNQENNNKKWEAFINLGAYYTDFKNISVYAIDQLINKIQYGNIGSVNLEIDEISTVISSNMQILNSFLDVYDKGITGDRFLKQTKDNKRLENINKRMSIPFNLMLMGIKETLMDSLENEENILSLLKNGYSRRTMFCSCEKMDISKEFKREDISDFLNILSDTISKICDERKFNKKFKLDKYAEELLNEYQNACIKDSNNIYYLNTIEESEILNRYFKVLKLSPINSYFSNKENRYLIDENNIAQSIKIVEDSAIHMNNLLNYKKPYEKISEYIIHYSKFKNITDLDLIDNLPFYKKMSKQNKRDNIIYAIDFALRNNNIIEKKEMENGITYYNSIETFQNDFNNIPISFNNTGENADNFKKIKIKWDNIHEILSLNNCKWCVHNFKDNKRKTGNLIKGFGLIAIDIDGTCSIENFKILFEDYKYFLITTKSHTEQENRFRAIFPLKNFLYLSANEYSAFMSNFYKYIPIKIDEATKDASRMWYCNQGEFIYNEGKLFNVFLFIENNNICQQQKNKNTYHKDYTGLEKWFTYKSKSGNRNNILYRFAMFLYNNGVDEKTLQEKIISFNEKIDEPLHLNELKDTIFKSMKVKFNNKET